VVNGIFHSHLYTRSFYLLTKTTTMAKGISLHLGVNHYNAKSYCNAPGSYRLQSLPHCEKDAIAMAGIAAIFQYETTCLMNDKATANCLLNTIQLAAHELDERDTFFLSFSGHGTRISDRDHDEDDGFDETWCLYDRMVTDDELFNCWKQFRPGVRIIVIADSCHSGTSIKNGGENVARPGGRFPAEKTDEVMASCLLLSACQDTQTALAPGNINYSLFTDRLLKVMNQYEFCDSYKELHHRVSRAMPPRSQPNLFPFGPLSDQLIRKRPFKL
jgi:metacaspase-1